MARARQPQARRRRRRRRAPRELGRVATGGSAADRIAAAYGLPRRLAAEVVRVAQRIGAQPFDLANLINFESGWNPQAVNKRSGATGLIQFMPSTARGLGTTTAAIKAMSALEQMPLVERYLRPYARKGLHTAERLYMAVFYPAAISWPRGRRFSATVQRYNPGIATPSDYVRMANRRARLPVGGGGGVVATARRAWPWALLAASLVVGGGLALRHRRRRRERRWRAIASGAPAPHWRAA